MGVFSYVIPFLLVFAIVFALLDKTKVLGNNKAIMVIVSLTIGLSSIQFDIVPSFFANIFPKLGIGLAIFIVIILLMGFFSTEEKNLIKKDWIGWILAGGIILWSLTSFNNWKSYPGIFSWIKDYFWTLVLLGVTTALIISGIKGSNNSEGSKSK